MPVRLFAHKGLQGLKVLNDQLHGRGANKMNKTVAYRENGAALIVALIMLLILTIVGIMALDASHHEVNIVGNQRVYNSAFYVAESGLDEFKTAPPVNSMALSIPFTSAKSLGVGGNTYRYKSDWIGLRDVGGVVYRVFNVATEGTAPNFPNAGKVTIEAVIEVDSGGGAGGGGGGPVDEAGKYN
jgi:hypothetical protein